MTAQPHWSGLYAERSRNVSSLGYPNYNAYLASEKWAQIRARILAKPECYACGRTATQVHHSGYAVEVLDGLDDSKLYAVCGRCHKRAHTSGKRHLGPDAATSRLVSSHYGRLGGGPRPKRKRNRNGGKLPYRRWLKLERQRNREAAAVSAVGVAGPTPEAWAKDIAPYL